MIKTRSTLPVAMGVAALVGVVLLARPDGAPSEDADLPSNTSTYCRGKTAEVVLGTQLSKKRMIKIRWWQEGTNKPPVTWNGTTDYWETVDPKMPCNGTLQFVVSPGDVWGGDTHCWVSVDGRDVAEDRTRQKQNCHLIVRLIES